MRSVEERSWVVQDLDLKMGFLQKELQGFVGGKVSNCSYVNSTWEVSQVYYFDSLSLRKEMDLAVWVYCFFHKDGLGEKKLKETHERKENEKKLKQVIKQEEIEKRLKEALKHKQLLRRLKETCEREEKEKRLREGEGEGRGSRGVRVHFF